MLACVVNVELVAVGKFSLIYVLLYGVWVTHGLAALRAQYTVSLVECLKWEKIDLKHKNMLCFTVLRVQLERYSYTD